MPNTVGEDAIFGVLAGNLVPQSSSRANGALSISVSGTARGLRMFQKLSAESAVPMGDTFAIHVVCDAGWYWMNRTFSGAYGHRTRFLGHLPQAVPRTRTVGTL